MSDKPELDIETMLSDMMRTQGRTLELMNAQQTMISAHELLLTVLLTGISDEARQAIPVAAEQAMHSGGRAPLSPEQVFEVTTHIRRMLGLLGEPNG